MKNFYIVLIALLSFSFGFGQVSVTTLPQTNTNDFSAYNGDALSTPTGWSVSPIDYEGIGSGTGTGGGFYAFHPTGNSAEKSFGVLRSGGSTWTFEVQFTNNTGSVITNLDISFNYEQYRYAGNTTGLDVEGTGALSGNATIDTEDFIGAASGTNGTVSNSDAVTINLTGLSIANGASYGLRWTAENFTGSDNGLAVDDFSITASNGGAPSPSVGFDNPTSTENETNTTFNISIPVTLSNYNADVDLSVTVNGSSTAEGGDYTLNTTALNFTGNGTLNVSLDINADADNDDETIILDIAETSATGITITTSQHTLTILDDDTPPLPNIVINEILADPTGIDANGDGTVETIEDEFVELVNNDITAVDITGYTLSDGGGVTHVFGSIVIPAGGSVVVFGGGIPTGIAGLSEVASTGTLSLNNGGDDVVLRNTSNAIIASYTYGSEGGNDQSLGRSEDLFGAFEQHTAIAANPVAASPGLYNRAGVPFSTLAWKGFTDTDWANGTNWGNGSGPLPGDDVLILQVSNIPTITTVVAVNSITANPGSGLIITSGSLTASTTIVMRSTSTSYSSLISDGTIVGTVRYDRYVNTNNPVNGNDLISAPLSGQAFDVFIDNNTNILAEPDPGTRVLFGGFDNNSSTDPYELWNETDTTILTAGVGYRTGIDATATSNLVTFEGDVNTSLVEVGIDQGSASILNLIGNPFPSFLDAQAFLTENAGLLDPSAQVIYGYNDSTDGTSAGDYTIISSLVNTTVDIAPGQGFFVASNTSGGNIRFTTNTPDMRVTSSQDDFIAGRAANSAITSIKLDLSTATDNFITDIFFTEFSSLGLDPGYDASLLGGTAPAFALYSHLVQENMGLPFAIQALGKMDYGDVTIPLGVNANQGEQLTFSISENTLPNTVDIYLDDTAANSSTLLNSGDYVLTPGTDLTGTGRFYLRFMNSALSTTDSTFEDVTIYTNQTDRSIMIAGRILEATVAHVYDLQGRLVMSQELKSQSQLQTLNASALHTGVYVVRLSHGTRMRAEKIILN